MKRGPTKGYTKDGASEPRDRSKSATRSRRSSSMGNQTLASHSHHLQQQQQQVSPSSSITLPPLVSLTNSVSFRNYSASSTGGASPNTDSKESNDLSQPASPRRNSGFGSIGERNLQANNSSGSTQSSSSINNAPQPQVNPNGTIPQGLFWKVPYSQGPFDRRGSVDSVSSSLSERSPRFSSTSSTATGGNFIFGQRPVSYESSVVSDSDDERGSNYSPRASIDIRANRSRSNSANLQVPTSPALSISSLNSLNQGFNKNLNIQNSNNNGVLAQQQQQQQNQIIELYYQFIHPSFPILPLNKQSLGNLLSIPPPNASDHQLINEIHEINTLIVQSFYASLDILITTTTRGSRSPSIVSLPNSNINSNPVELINQIFNNLMKIFPIFQTRFNLYSQNIVILLASTLVLSSYAITLLGFESDVYVSSSISIFNKLKIFRLFWDPSHLVTSENYDDYNSILKRLYIDLYIIDTLQSLSFGIPKSLNLDYEPSIVDSLFPNFANFNGASGVDFDLTKNNLKFGIILSKIGSSRNFANPRLNTFLTNDLKNKYNFFSNTLVKNSKSQDQISINFLESLLSKFELVGFLEEVSQIIQNDNKIDEELAYDFQLKSLRIVKKHLEVQSTLLKSIKNYTNSIETSSIISPFLPLVFKQSVKALNIQKIIINSLQINKDLITRLSKPLNDLISLNNYLSLLKPFKNDDFNNHLRFLFVSDHLKYLDFSSNEQSKEFEKLNHWIGLMKDLKEFIQRDDYDGWF